MHKSAETLFGWTYKLLKHWGCNDIFAAYFGLFVNITMLCVLSYLIYIVFRFALVTIMAVVAKKTM